MSPRGVAGRLHSLLQRMDALPLPKLQAGEIYGAATLGGLILLLLLVRWLAG